MGRTLTSERDPGNAAYPKQYGLGSAQLATGRPVIGYFGSE